MNASFHFDSVDSFTAGAVGPKGQRVFFLQALAEGSVVTLQLEKQQVAALGTYIEDVLSELDPVSIDEFMQAGELVEPTAPEWIIGGLGVAYDQSADRVVLLAEELTEEDEFEVSTARFGLTRAQAVAFSAQARMCVDAGRAPCPYCARPLDPTGTWCPCHN